MEGRGSPPKTFRERLNAINFPDDKIPEEYIDHHVTLDIMQNPIKVHGTTSGIFIMDHSGFAEFNLQELKKWAEKTNHGKIFYDSTKDPGFTSIAGGQDGMSKLEHMLDLRNEIEAWVTRQETLHLIQQIDEGLRKKQPEEAERSHQEAILKQQKSLEKNQKKIKEINLHLDNHTTKLHALLHPDCLSPVDTKVKKIKEQLSFIETLNHEKNKLLLGSNYYSNPENLEYEINRLNRKKEMREMAEEELKDFYFNEEDEKELTYCYQCLDTLNLNRFPGGLFHPSTSQPILNPEPSSIARLGRGEEQ